MKRIRNIIKRLRKDDTYIGKTFTDAMTRDNVIPREGNIVSPVLARKNRKKSAEARKIFQGKLDWQKKRGGIGIGWGP